MQPSFLIALDHPTLVAPDCWVAHCPVFGCTDLVEIGVVDGEYRFACDSFHTHEEVVAYLALGPLDLLTESARYAGLRGWYTLMLARTPEAWSQLLQGRPVPADQLDPEFLARARARRTLTATPKEDA